MPDYLAAARNANNPATRRKFLRLHREQKERDRILACTNCELADRRRHAVPWNGPLESKLVLVGEAPGANEDKTGEPFVGQAGKMLNQCLTTAGLDRADTMVMNVIACRPPNNQDPVQKWVSACKPHRDRQLHLSHAFVGVMLGLQPYKHLTGNDDVRMKDVVNKPFWMEGRVWIPTYHPAYILRNRQMRYMLVEGLTTARRIIDGEVGWPKLPKPSPDELWGPMGEGNELGRRMDKHGYAVVWSNRLDDYVVVTRDEHTKVPSRHRGTVTYTVEELTRLGEMGQVGKLTVEGLRGVHLVKAAFGGKVVG